MKRIFLGLVAAALLSIPASAQLPPAGGISIGKTPIQGGTNGQCLYQDSNGKVGEQACGGSGITVGTTTITSGTSGRVLYDNAGVVGEMTNTGTGTVNVLQTAPAFVTSITLPSVAYASIPAPGNAGKIVRVSDFGTKGSLLMDDGTRWKPMNGCTVLATLDTVSSSIPNSEAIVFQYAIPANALQNKDRLRLRVSLTKSGATDTATMRFRMGTAGTTGDTLLYSGTALAAANRTSGIATDLRLETATTIQQLANSSSAGATVGYSAVANTAAAAAVTITSAAANALFFSVSIFTSSTNDTVAMLDGQLDLCASAN